jgi:hypothetical protein
MKVEMIEDLQSSWNQVEPTMMIERKMIMMTMMLTVRQGQEILNWLLKRAELLEAKVTRSIDPDTTIALISFKNKSKKKEAIQRSDTTQR